MAGAWLKVEHETPDKPEVMQIAAKLNITADEAFGICFRMWRWFDQHTQDGNARGVTFALLDRYLGVTGFAQVALQVGWLQHFQDGEISGLRQPNFDYHNGESAKKRGLTAKRARDYRTKHGAKKPSRKRNAKSNATDVTRSSLLFSLLLSCSLECGIPVPKSLCTEKFREAWNKWVKHREEIKAPLKPTQVEAQLQRLAERGEADAVRVIMHTVGQGWQGLREPDANGGNGTSGKSKSDPRGTFAAAESYLQKMNALSGNGENENAEIQPGA